VSAKITRQILDSALDPSLKFAAIVLANCGNGDGANIFPSIELISYRLGKTPRQAKRLVGQLRDAGIVVPIGSVKGGRAKSVTYQFNTAALPAREPFISSRKGDTHVTVCEIERVTSTTERVTSEAETVTSMAGKGDTHVTRSLSDLIEGSVSGSRSASALPPPPSEEDDRKNQERKEQDRLLGKEQFAALKRTLASKPVTRIEPPTRKRRVPQAGISWKTRHNVEALRAFVLDRNGSEVA
jgi:hypothetical protein